MACCPAHKDDDPSQAITVTPQGKILLHCFAGCSSLEITQSLNLTLADLFADEPHYQESPMGFAKREMREREQNKNKVTYAQTFCAIVTSRLRQHQHVGSSDINKARQLKQWLIQQGKWGEVV